MKSNNKKGKEVLNKISPAARKKLKTVDVQLKNTNHLESKEHKKTKKSLRKSEEHYRFLFENMLNGFAYCQMLYENGRPKDFIYLNVNKTFESLTGLKNVIGRKVTDVIPRIREFDNNLFEIYSRVALTGKPENFEMFIKSLNDWYSISVYSPKKESFIAIFDVITERKQTEEALQKSEARFRQTLDNMLEGCMLIGYDWRYLYLNEAAANHGHQKRENLIGKTLLEMYPGVEKSEIFAGYKQCMEERISKQFEYSFTFSDGSINWYSFSVQPVPEGIFVLSLDITEHKHAEKILRETQEKIQKIFDSSPDAIWMINLDGTIAECNETTVKLHRYSSKEEFLGKSGYNFVVESERQRAMDMMRDLLSKGTMHGVELTMLRKDGSQFVAESAGSVLRDSSGKPTGLVVITKDITERKRTEEKLGESELRFKQVSESAHEWIWEVDLNGLYTYVTPVIKELLGYEAEELVGIKYFYDFFDPEIKEEMKQAALAAFARKESFRNFINCNIHKDGRRIILSTTGIPILDKENNLIGYRGADVDITERLSAVEAIKDSEEKYRKLVELSPDAVLIHVNGIIQFVNAASVRLFDAVNKDDLIGKKVIDFVHTDYKKIILQRIGKVIDEEVEVPMIEEKLVSLKGRTFDAEVTAIPIKLLGQNGVQVVARDITERKHAEEEIAMLAHSLRSINECVSITDMKDNILFVNESFLKTYGYSKNELIGKNMTIARSPNNLPELTKEILPATIRGGWRGELLNKRKDGSEFPIYLSTTIINDKDNKPLGQIGVAVDITERKRAEEEIISQKNRFEQLFENSPIAIALLDDHDNVVEINESFSNLFGYFLEEIKGQSLNDIIVPTELKEEAISFSVQTLRGNYINKESYRMKKDSTLIYVQYVGVPVIINDKTVNCYALYVDLTQRKDSEDRMKVAKELAEQSDKLKSEFLAQMSHEIRTPINAIVGNVDFLNNLFDESMDADTRDCFDGIGLASKRIIRTVDLILNVSELQTSGYKPYKVKVDLDSEILNKLYKEHQLSAKEKELELIYKCESKDTKIIADLYSVTQIFANLIDNAIKYTKKGKVEVLLTKNKNGNVVVEIKDTGIGMSKEFLSRMFEPFVQEDKGYTRSYDGSGLGLTLVKNYCDINNATIEVESEKNVGSTFRVIFNK